MSESTYKIILFSFCFLKQSASKAANGVSKVRAFCGHPFTQAQQRIHFSTSVLHSSPFAMAPAGLVEAGFINNDKDNETFDKNFNQIANGIADGILKTLGIKPNTNNTLKTWSLRR